MIRFVILLTISHLCLSLRYTNTSCLETYKLDRTNKDEIACKGEHVVNHCIPDDQHKEVKVCVQWKWIEPGYCPYYDTISDVIKEMRCSFYCLRNEDLHDVCKCSSTYNDDDSCNKKCEYPFGSDKYIFCDHEKFPGLDISTVDVTLEGFDTRNAKESQIRAFDVAVPLAVVVVAAVVVAVAVVVIVRIKRRQHRLGNRRSAEVDVEVNSWDENNQNLLRTENANEVTSRATDDVTPDDIEDNTQLLSGENQIGNNGRQETVECIKGNQSERNDNEDVDVELNAPSVTDQSSNQTVKADSNNEKKEIQTHADDNSGEEENSVLEDVVVDNTLRESDNGGGSSNNVSMKHVDEQEHQSNIADTHLNSSADSGSDQDENEDTSKNITVTEGIFVDSLQSISKEDDEEGGWSEIQELLEYMCTGPARKILFNVVKMYVENPDSYFQDESKKASVKTVLRPEYHSAHDHESEYRYSIPVLHAILQVSLSEKHRPKSGWGQKVKDTDTGVGDDVERVYQVYSLNREIQNSEEISVDGYVRLFEMLIGAVERLDIKGKCSEDYRKIVRRWENIQRKLWVKDKWTTFTNFIQKWSPTE